MRKPMLDRGTDDMPWRELGWWGRYWRLVRAGMDGTRLCRICAGRLAPEQVDYCSDECAARGR